MAAEFFNGAPIITRLPGIAQPELSPIGNGYIYFDSASGKLKASQNGGMYVDLIGGGGGGGTLAATLVLGNTTGGTNIVVSSGDAITGAAGLPLSAAAGSDLTLAARGSGAIPFNQAGETNLDIAFTGVGRNSVIGALNALVDGTIVPSAPALSSVLTVGNTTGGHDIQVSAGDSIVGVTALTLAAAAASDLTFNARSSGAIPFNQAGETNLDVAFTGIGRTSIIGALNALVDGGIVPATPTLSAVLASGNTTGANNIIVSAGQRIDTAAAGTLNLGTVGATTAVNVGSAGNPTNLPGNVVVGGNFTVNGTVTTINSTNTTIADQLLLIASNVPSQVFSAYTIERGSSGDDLLFLWNPTDTRTEIGFFNTVGGTTAPSSALTTLSDLRVNDITLAGTSITADAQLDLASTGVNNVNVTTSNQILFNTAGHYIRYGLGYMNLASDGGVYFCSDGTASTAESYLARVGVRSYRLSSDIAGDDTDRPITFSIKSCDGTNLNCGLDITSNSGTTTFGANYGGAFGGTAVMRFVSGGGNGIYLSNFVLGPFTDTNSSLGDASHRWLNGFFSNNVTSPLFTVSTNVNWRSGSGSPEGVVAAAVGSFYSNITGASGSTFYVKESGAATSSGWTAASLSAQSLAQTLVVGNITGGTSIVVSSGDLIRGVDAAAGTDLALRGGNSSGSNAGGNVSLTGGAASVASNSGGAARVVGGIGVGATGQGGAAQLTGGAATGAYIGGTAAVTGGGAASGYGGDATITGGTGLLQGGQVLINGGACTGDSNGSVVSIVGGPASGTNRNGGQIQVISGSGIGSGSGGTLTLLSGIGGVTGSSGFIDLRSGNGGTTSGSSGDVSISTGITTDGATGSISLNTASSTGTNRVSGSISISTGNATGSAAAGSILMTAGQSVTGTAGAVTLTAGPGGSTSGVGGTASLVGGDGVNTNAAGGPSRVYGGNGFNNGAGGTAFLVGGNGGDNGNGGLVSIQGGSGGALLGRGGNVDISAGYPSEGRGGFIFITASPGVTGLGNNQNGGDIQMTAGDAATDGTPGNITGVAGTTDGTHAGGSILWTAGQGGATGGSGGTASLIAGAGRVTGFNGGDAIVQGGAAVGASNGGSANLIGGTPGDTGDAGGAFLTTQSGGSVSGNGGSIQLSTGGATLGNGGPIQLYCGGSSEGEGGYIEIFAGNAGTATSSNHNGGAITIISGNAVVDGLPGDIFITAGNADENGVGAQIRLDGGLGGTVSGTGGPCYVVGGDSRDGVSQGGICQMNGGRGSGSSYGGHVAIQGGQGGNAGGPGGDASINGGFGGSAGGNGGAAYCFGGSAQVDGFLAGGAFLSGGAGFGSGAGALAFCSGGVGGATGDGGDFQVRGGDGGPTSGNAGNVLIRGGVATDGDGGSITVQGTNGTGTDKDGGAITVVLGAATGAGTNGVYTITDASSNQLLKVEYTGGLLARYSVEAVTAATNALAATETRKVLTNEGAGAEPNNQLPAAAAGLVFTLYCQDATGIRATATGGATIRLTSTESASNGYIRSSVVGSAITLVAINSTQWVATSSIGTWTVDA